MPEEDASSPWSAWRGRIGAARKLRDANVADWQDNVNKRKSGGTAGTRSNAPDNPAPRQSSGSGSGSVNKDWPLTKAKIALLYSQTPEARLSTEDPRAAQVVPQHAKALNQTIKKEQVGASIKEELADVINASGISGVIIACDKRTETKDVPKYDPMVAAMSGMTENPMVPVTTVVDIRYPVRRISPTQLLIPADFTGSVYDQARWLGYEGSLPWAVAKTEFQLTDDVKEKVCGGKNAKPNLNTDTSTSSNEDVCFHELFYWRHFYHEEETSFSALQRIVFVEGLEEPPVNEAYQGQQRTADGQIVGVTRNPIQILTLSYISDDPLPPSDSTISRGDVNELEEMHEQLSLQRKHSIPMRWYNPDMVSAGAKARIERGDFQDIFPVRGQGDRALGQIAPASFPPEKYELHRLISGEMTEKWTVGPNQSGGFSRGEQSAREVSVVERNFQTRIGQERAQVEQHFLAIAEVLSGLMALHGATPIPPELLGAITYGIHVDATVLLDADAQIERIAKGLNLTAQSGFVNVKRGVAKIWELLGEDPNEMVVDPQPKAPEPVKVSISNAVDLMHPMMLAELSRTQQLPTPDDVSAVVKLLAAIGQIPGMAALLVPPTAPADPNAPPAEVQTPGIANPDWETAPRIERRAEDGGA